MLARGEYLTKAADCTACHTVPGSGKPFAGGIAFRLPAGAAIGVRIHYKKTWQFEGKALSDRSTVGIYFAPGNQATQLLMVPLEAPEGDWHPTASPRAATSTWSASAELA